MQTFLWVMTELFKSSHAFIQHAGYLILSHYDGKMDNIARLATSTSWLVDLYMHTLLVWCCCYMTTFFSDIYIRQYRYVINNKTKTTIMNKATIVKCVWQLCCYKRVKTIVVYMLKSHRQIRVYLCVLDFPIGGAVVSPTCCGVHQSSNLYEFLQFSFFLLRVGNLLVLDIKWFHQTFLHG